MASTLPAIGQMAHAVWRTLRWLAWRLDGIMEISWRPGTVAGACGDEAIRPDRFQNAIDEADLALRLPAVSAPREWR